MLGILETLASVALFLFDGRSPFGRVEGTVVAFSLDVWSDCSAMVTMRDEVETGKQAGLGVKQREGYYGYRRRVKRGSGNM